MGETQQPIDILVLGKGWTGTYIVDQCTKEQVSVAATTRDGRDGTIAFAFDPSNNDDASQYYNLPTATTFLITFPVTSENAIETLIGMYRKTRPEGVNPDKIRYILFGTTGNYSPVDASVDPWCDRHTLLTNLTDRNKGESHLLKLYPQTSTILHLSGLYNETTRNPRNFISRIAPTKAAVESRKSVHYIHGVDVARAVLAVHRNFQRGEGRWIITNMRVYDWWDFLSTAVPTGWDVEKQGDPEMWAWVLELMGESGVKGLPRSVEQLGKGVCGREFWEVHGLVPYYSRL
ncbi:hypothetical protein BDR26DRAFT_810694 [Obelidium mucronatum]|nr:hypothetical protein BDR26DRAFT_810694 [Obelidium mucronatum]